jgi:cysteinyl-tRNA synthetase, unknown class
MMKGKAVLFGLLAIILFSHACIDRDWLDDDPPDPVDFKKAMAGMVIEFSSTARQSSPDFIIVAMDGEALYTTNGDSTGPVNEEYRDAIDGLAVQKMFYGSINVNLPSPPSERELRIPFLNLARQAGKSIFSVEYCSTAVYVDNAISQVLQLSYIPFASATYNCSGIPVYPVQPVNSHSGAVTALSSAMNFLYLSNPDSFSDRSVYLAALDATNYDVLIIDPYYDGQIISSAELNALQSKAGGGRRLVLANIHLGIARNDRYYWDPEWNISKPSWIMLEDPENPGHHFVKYWDRGWRELLYLGQGSMLERILDAGFDGLMLEGADSYRLFDL